MCIRDRFQDLSIVYKVIIIADKDAVQSSKITTRSTLASSYIEEQKTRGKDEIPENLTDKMYGAITSFKEKYTMIQDVYKRQVIWDLTTEEILSQCSKKA